MLHSERFCDVAPAEVMATLLDEGIYLASERTMYRLLAKRGASRERHNQLRHPHYRRPELLATGPNQLWSWDITKLLGPAKWTYYYLYVILDVFSRYVTGWMVAHRETAALARRLIADTIASEQVPAGTLTVHADRGSSMTSPICTHRTEIGADTTNSPPRTRASHQPCRRSALRGWYTGRLESDHRPHSLITVGPRQQPSA